MGTPEFAVASLDALLKAGVNVVAVVTSADKPAGRGRKLHQSAVKVYALEHGIPVLQPEKLKDPAFAEELKSYRADLQVVVAFRMLPERIWNMPPHGTINLHASLLPQYRGAAPINWAVINGETETGVTTFKLKHEIDTGDILFNRKVTISEDETAGDVHDKLMLTGAGLLVETVKAIESGSYHEMPQEPLLARGEQARHAPKLFKEDCLLDWNQTARSLHNRIRGLSPYPAAYTTLGGKTLKIYRSACIEGPVAASAGSPLSDGKTYLRFACSNGYIDLLEVQLEGKKRMGIEEFLRGHKL